MKKLSFISALLIVFFQLSAQKSELWGTTNQGGDYSAGVIFKTDSNGTNIQVMHSFYKNDGDGIYEGLVLANNGKFYGMTCNGGAYDAGVIYEYDSTFNTFTKKYEFHFADGKEPKGRLIEATNGKLYGLTSRGGNTISSSMYGSWGCGVLFEYDYINNIYTKKVEFDDITGINPEGSLIQASNGKLYGTTVEMGLFNGSTKNGTIFEYDILTDQLTVLNYFDTLIGYWSNSYLCQANNGRLYGTTMTGGQYNYGGIFEFNIQTNQLLSVFDFNPSVSGNYPSGSLIKASNGDLYGVNHFGGAYGGGTIYKFEPGSQSFQILYDFGLQTLEWPIGNIVLTASGNIVGCCERQYQGGLFEFNPSTHNFSVLTISGYNSDPYGFTGTMIPVSATKYLGVTSATILGAAVIYEYTIGTDTLITKIVFDGGDSGIYPYGGILYASNKKFYGLATNIKYGNIYYGHGYLYEFDPNTNDYSAKVAFNYTNGSRPIGKMIEYKTGKLIGITISGSGGDGTIFTYDLNTAVLTTVHNFNGIDGDNPYADLLLASNGKIYGTTMEGGLHNFGVLFEMDPLSFQFVKLFDFDGYDHGKNPVGKLAEDNSGNLWGVTRWGGQTNDGVIYSYNISTGTLIKRHDFNYSLNGYYPRGGFLLADNNKFYGTFINNYSTNAYVYDPSIDSLARLYYHNEPMSYSNSGVGSLIQAANGKIYGYSLLGYLYGHGSIFEIDPAIDSMRHRAAFNFFNGAHPLFSSLTETFICYPTFDTISITVCNKYLSPNGLLITHSGLYNDTLQNICGGDSIVTSNVIIDTIDITLTQNNLVLHANQDSALYQWLDCNNGFAIIPGEIYQDYTVTNNGTYAVVISKNQCIDTSLCITINNAGITNPLERGYSVYPNPATDVLYFKLNIVGEFLISIYDFSGKKVRVKKFNYNNIKLSVSDLPPSIYYFRIENENGLVFRGRFGKR